MIGFKDWPEYSEPGDWLDYSAGVPPTAAVLSPSLSTPIEQDLPATEVPPLSPYRSVTNHHDLSNYQNNRCTPPAKKVKLSISCESSIGLQTKAMRLPTPCPLPAMFTEDVAQAIANSNIKGIMKIRLERQAASYYYGLCPWPKSSEYNMMAKTMCDRYPQLKSSKCEEYTLIYNYYGYM